MHLGRWGEEGSKEGKRKLCTVPIGRVCSSVRYRSQCQHTLLNIATATQPGIPFPTPFQPDTPPASLTFFYCPLLVWTGCILPFLPLSVLPQGPVHQCHVPRAKWTDLLFLCALSSRLRSHSLYILQAWHLARHWFNITDILCAFQPLSHYPLFPTPTTPLSYGHWPLAFSILYSPQKELFVLE